MAHPHSHSFRGDAYGVLLSKAGDKRRQPNPDERERALGYLTGATAAPGVPEAQRHAITGRCMDANALAAVMAAVMALAGPSSPDQGPSPAASSVAPLLHSVPVPQLQAGAMSSGMSTMELDADTDAALRTQMHLIFTATITDAVLAETQHTDPNSAGKLLDIWMDKTTMQLITEGAVPPGLPAQEVKRATRRASSYEYLNGVLKHRLVDNSLVICPPPADRKKIAEAVHVDNGHWGERRTNALLGLKYWWRGMYEAVREAIKNCPVCDKVNKVNFVRSPMELMSLPIGGRNYRWSLDCSGPYEVSAMGNRVCLHMIEHFTKLQVSVAIISKESKYVAYAFSTHVLAMHGAPAEVLTDQGGEFTGKFEDLLVRHLIDHRYTSAEHPQANGLAERVVKSTKACLAKVCADPDLKNVWDERLPDLVAGYNCAPQASTGFSPSHLMFGTKPSLPSEAPERLSQPINFDDAEVAVDDLLTRMDAISKISIMAGGNLLIAQHRDQLHYARRRGGSLTPRARRLEPGDYVYIQPRGNAGPLAFPVDPAILRVAAVEPGGVVRLMDKAGQVFPVRQEQCTKCHLPGIDGSVDYTLLPAQDKEPCEVCLSTAHEEMMLLCDGCNTGWHRFCLNPPLTKEPEGPWCCPRCVANGVDADLLTKDADGRAIRNPKLDKKVDEARSLHGRYVLLQVKDQYQGTINSLYGKVVFKQKNREPLWLSLVLEDGSVRDGLDVATVRKVVLPKNAVLPDRARQRLHPYQLVTVSSTAVSSDFDYGSRSGVEAALNILMPGSHTNRHVTDLFNAITALRRPTEDTMPCVETMISEVLRLAQCIDLSRFHTATDMWSGSRTIGLTLAKYGIKTVSNDLDSAKEADYHLDALQPSSYRTIASKEPGSMSLIVSSPWFSLMDLAAPLAVMQAGSLACLHVSSSYLGSPVEPRAQWAASLARQGRLHVVKGVEANRSLKRKCAWLVIAKTPELLKQLLRPEAWPTTLSINFV
jgi:hypothetical protein